MFDTLELLWRFFSSQPVGRYFALYSWHLQLILIVLGLLAAGGLHHLIGFTFRFYRVNEDHRHWLGMPTLVLLLISLQLLLGCYTLFTQADAFVRMSLNTEETIQPAGILGEQLLAPAFASPDLARSSNAGVAKERLAAAVRNLPADQYRKSLQPLIVDPDRITLVRESSGAKSGDAVSAKGDATPANKSSAEPKSDTPPEPPSIVVNNKPELVTMVLVQMALRWVNDANREWPQLAAKPEGQPTATDPVPLPDFIVSLVGEIQDGVTLDRLDWEHVAGHRFSASVMQPVLVRYVTRTAIFGTVTILVFNGFYFFGFYRLRRWMQRKRAEAKEKAPPTKAEAVNSPPH